MLPDIDNFLLQQQEPVKSCLQALRSVILSLDKDVSAAWRYKMPFFCYKGKRFCYLWIHKKYNQPYIGFVEGKKIIHPALIQEDRIRMKIMLVDPEIDLPIKTIQTILRMAMNLCR